MNTDTPRTDALAKQCGFSGGAEGYEDAAYANFARQLERENNTLRNAQKACEDCDAPTMEKIRQLERELNILNAPVTDIKTLRVLSDLQSGTIEVVHADVARKLQRELNEAKQNSDGILRQFKEMHTDRDRWRTMAVELGALIKEMDDDLKDNMPEYERLEGVTDALSRFNAMNKETK